MSSRGGTLVLRLSIAVGALLFVCCVAVGAWLDVTRATMERELRDARHVYVLASLRQRVETSLSLGLGLESLTGFQRLSEAEAAADPGILSIDLFDDLGRVIFTTDPVGIDANAPESWMEGLRALPTPETGQTSAPISFFRIPERRGEAIGIVLVNDFGARSGGLVLRHSRESSDRTGPGAAALLAPPLLASALAIALISGFGFYFACRPLERAAAALQRWFATGDAQQLRTRLEDAGLDTAHAPLTKSVAALAGGLDAADRRCAAARAELEQIDARA